MIEKTVKIQNLKEHRLNSAQDDLLCWLKKTADERISAVEDLRKQYYGSTARLQRSVRIIQRT